MELHNHHVLYLMDKVIFALQPKLLCLNHQQSFEAYVFKVLSGNAISFIRITISAFYEPDVGILKHDVIFSHTIFMIVSIYNTLALKCSQEISF